MSYDEEPETSLWMAFAAWRLYFRRAKPARLLIDAIKKQAMSACFFLFKIVAAAGNRRAISMPPLLLFAAPSAAFRTGFGMAFGVLAALVALRRLSAQIHGFGIGFGLHGLLAGRT